MVSAVTSSTYNSYLNQLAGGTNANATVTPTTPGETSSASGTSSATSTQRSLVSSLLSGGAYSTSVLSLLQPSQTGSFDPITDLLGGSGTSDALTGLYDNLYASSTAAALTKAQANSTATQSSGSVASAKGIVSAQDLIATQTQASIAYNQTLQQNAANILDANSYGPNGITKLVG